VQTPSTPNLVFSINPAAVAKVFDQLGGQMGAKLAALYGKVNPALVRAEWSRGLASLSNDEIERGLEACLTRQFAPTLGEFMHLCRPSLDGEIAWTEAEEGLKARRQGEHGEWSHPAVYRAARVMSETLRLGNYRANRNRWEHVLRTEFAKGFVEPVPPVPVPIVNNPTLSPMPARIREQLVRAGILVKRGAK
jgi:hypothetical protein